MLGKNTKDRGAPAPTPNAATSAIPSQSVIGQGMTITGDCITDGLVRIQGTVAGNVTANGLELATGGTVEGDVSVPETGKKGQVFVVAGRVAGRVRAHIVDVKKGGSVLGGIEAEELTIHGSVEGDVRVRHRLLLASTAVVSGDVRTDRLVMEEGGRVNGTIKMGRPDARERGSDATPKSDKGAEPAASISRDTAPPAEPAEKDNAA